MDGSGAHQLLSSARNSPMASMMAVWRYNEEQMVYQSQANKNKRKKTFSKSSLNTVSMCVTGKVEGAFVSCSLMRQRWRGSWEVTEEQRAADAASSRIILSTTGICKSFKTLKYNSNFNTLLKILRILFKICKTNLCERRFRQEERRLPTEHLLFSPR